MCDQLLFISCLSSTAVSVIHCCLCICLSWVPFIICPSPAAFQRLPFTVCLSSPAVSVSAQAEVDFAADAGSLPSPVSAFVTCATSLTEGGQTSSHADDTRALMTAVLLGGISQDDLTVQHAYFFICWCILPEPQTLHKLYFWLQKHCLCVSV